MESSPAAPPPPARLLPWLLPPWLLGTVLRLWGLPHQVLVGDETHGVRVALGVPLDTILTTYRPVDPCIPLAALYRVLGEAGVGLSEVVLRLPSVLAGLALLVAFPLLLARWEGGRRGIAWAATFAWLLALSPGLVYYSRIARPYAVVALLAPLAAASFWRWWRGGGTGWAALYAVAGALSTWFHLATVPFVAAPLAFAALDALVRRRGGVRTAGRGIAAAVTAGAGLAAGMAAFLGPAWRSFVRLLKVKSGGSSIDLSGVSGVLFLEAGSTSRAVAVLFWAVALAGTVVLFRERRRATLFGTALVAAQWVGIVAVFRPDGVGLPLVAHRYVLATLPVLLLVVSRGLVAAWAWGRGRAAPRRWAGAAVPPAVVALLGLTSPYLEAPWLRLGPFAGTNQAASFLQAPPRLAAERVPAVYHLLGREPGAGAVVEAPGARFSFRQDLPMSFARVHGRPVVLAVDGPWTADPRLRLRTLVGLKPRLMEEVDARFVVVHLDRPRWSRLQEDPESPEAQRPTPRNHPTVALGRRLAADLHREWGEPHLVDADVLVWDLARVGRASGVTRRSPGPAGGRRPGGRGGRPRPRRPPPRPAGSSG